MKRIFLVIPFLQLITACLIAQENKDVLISIDDFNVSAQEFARVYNKNNTTGTMNSKSVDEYLDLYINFKMKVLEAKNLGYDTVASFKEELAGYREKLAQPYLEGVEITEEMIKEAYDRMTQEVEVSHILYGLKKNPLPEDTLELYNKALKTLERIKSGDVSFEEASDEYNDDPYVKNNGGYLGYFSGMTMVQSFEDAAYKTPIGEITGPVGTSFGYHLIKVTNKRPSKGEAKASHIYFKVSQNADSAVWQKTKSKADSVYHLIQSGQQSFSNMVREFSDDRESAKNDGNVGFFKAGKMVPEFAETALAMDSIGQIAKPVRTMFGYHIIKLTDIKPVPEYSEVKDHLKQRLMSGRHEKLNRQKAIRNFKNKYEIVENNELIDELIDTLDRKYLKEDSFNEVQYPKGTIFNIDEKKYTSEDFIAYAKTWTRPYFSQPSLYEAYGTYLEKEIMEYADSMLEIEYPEFRHLMQEYRDGILLFNIMSDKVWNYASKDTAGLKAFYQENKENYMWDKRADITQYIFADSSLTTNIKQEASDNIAQQVNTGQLVQTYCDTTAKEPCVKVGYHKFEKRQNDKLDQMQWQKGNVSEVFKTEDGQYSIIAINDILEPEIKKLEEARGIIVADYQEVLEKQWVSELKEKYEVTINEKLLKKVKKGKFN